MVRPLLEKIINNHFKLRDNDHQSITYFKQTNSSDIEKRFNLERSSESKISARQIASFLDPRYKNLDHEPIIARESIRSTGIDLLNKINIVRDK